MTKTDSATRDCPQRLAYSIKEAAEVSSLGRTSIYSLISSGKLRPIKVGQRTVIPHADLAALLGSGEEDAGQND